MKIKNKIMKSRSKESHEYHLDLFFEMMGNDKDKVISILNCSTSTHVDLEQTDVYVTHIIYIERDKNEVVNG